MRTALRRTGELAGTLTERKPLNHISKAFKALDNASDRSVHIKVHPRPRSLNESSQVLNELRRYGEIEVFKHMKYDLPNPAPNSCLVIYKHASAAEKAINDNLHDFQYSEPPRPPESLAQTESEIYSHREPFDRPCRLVMRKAKVLHLLNIERQAYYWPQDIPLDSGKPGLAMIARTSKAMRGLRDFDVRKGEATFRMRDLCSRTKNRQIEARRWRTLNELWELGQKERMMASDENKVNAGTDVVHSENDNQR